METPVPLNSGVCPVCATPVEGKIAGGIWSGYIKALGWCSGLGYVAVCKKCGVELWSCPTDEAAAAGVFDWEVREPRVHVKQHHEVEAELVAILKPLLEHHAEREHVTRSLGLKFTDYSVGSLDHPELRKWLFFDEVNEAASRYPGILFHMDATTMTWLFFDDELKLQGYFIRRS